VVITVTSTPPAGGSAGLQPVCVVFDDAAGQWSTTGVEWVNATELTCLTSLDRGTYTVAWESASPLALPMLSAGDGALSAGGLAAIIFVFILACLFGSLALLAVFLKQQQGQGDTNDNKKEAQDGPLFLPSKLRDVVVLASEGADIYRVEGRNLSWDIEASAAATDVNAPGIAYRTSKDLESKHPYRYAAWGERIVGTDEGDGWIRVLAMPTREPTFSNPASPTSATSGAIANFGEQEPTETSANEEPVMEVEPTSQSVLRDEHGDVVGYSEGEEWVRCI
jgi:hypothetical protein